MEKKFYNNEGKEIKRTECQVYTRVMGYLRPVSHYNTGKKTEFYSRKYFVEGTKSPREHLTNQAIESIKENNQKFIQEYSIKL